MKVERERALPVGRYGTLSVINSKLALRRLDDLPMSRMDALGAQYLKRKSGRKKRKGLLSSFACDPIPKERIQEDHSAHRG